MENPDQIRVGFSLDGYGVRTTLFAGILCKKPHFSKYHGKVFRWVLWVVERLTTIVGTIVGALVGVDSGTMLASCSGVAEFPLYPCTQTTYSLPPSVCSCAY